MGQKIIDEFHVSTGSGRAFHVKAGQFVEFQLVDGSQVIDLNIFNSEMPEEHFGSSVTRPVHGTHVTVGDDLLSCPPWERPIATVVADSVIDGVETGSDTSTVRSHDLLYGRCSRALRRFLYDSDTPGCQEILTSAIQPAGLTELDVHDPLNIFMRTGIDGDGKLFFVPPVASDGDAFRLLMRIDALVAMSCCPGESSGPDPRGATVVVFGE